VLLALPGCREDDGQAGIQEPAPVLSLPGVLSRPDTAGFVPVSVDSLEGILLFTWLPLEDMEMADQDLVFLATLTRGGILPAPVMFDPAARNAAQRRVNRLGLPLTVYLGDAGLRAFMGFEALPAAMLALPGETGERAEGTGCARRVMREEQ
jgi:hypothetical protein